MTRLGRLSIGFDLGFGQTSDFKLIVDHNGFGLDSLDGLGNWLIVSSDSPDEAANTE